MYCNNTSGSGIFPAPVSPQAKYPVAGSTTCIPYFFNIFRLSCTISFSNMPVFIAGDMIFGHLHAKIVVVSISSAIPCAIFAITFAEAGATKKTSAFFAIAMCSTEKEKFRSNVSTRHLFPVNVSNVIGLINCVAFCVIITSTSACNFFNALARPAIL